MFSFFHGGVHPDDSKANTRHKQVEYLPPPEFLILPLSMHIGAPCEPCVTLGDDVLLGQVIANSGAPVAAPIHSPVSGRVTAIEPRSHPNGSRVMSIVIQNDGLDKLHPEIAPYGSVESLTPEELLGVVRDAGIVGLGGAAFPAHVKVRSGLGKVTRVIINGCECEPYITSDHRLLLESPEEVLGGLKILMKIFGINKGTIAIEANKRDAIENIRRTLPRRGEGIEVRSLAVRYPQGAEKQLIQAVADREVPPGALPAAVGVAVFNVDTAAAIHRAVTTGMPLLRRIVTVSGSAVSNAKNLSVRIGTPMETVFAATGGFRETPGKVLAGGPMMGIAQFDLTAPVVKSTNALLAFSQREVNASREQTCIRCGKCVQVCPMKLEPTYLYMYERKNRTDMLEKYHLSDCIECGSCAYICPGRLHLVHSVRTGKQKLNAARAAAKEGK
ncbi:MAG: electron transport complex subunit RsxC [Oscillospiraceae bacterium]|nr:electron transport complex subunit RsxC [Oscillospiraceae bacterium]